MEGNKRLALLFFNRGMYVGLIEQIVNNVIHYSIVEGDHSLVKCIQDPSLIEKYTLHSNDNALEVILNKFVKINMDAVRNIHSNSGSYFLSDEENFIFYKNINVNMSRDYSTFNGEIHLGSREEIGADTEEIDIDFHKQPLFKLTLNNGMFIAYNIKEHFVDLLYAA